MLLPQLAMLVVYQTSTMSRFVFTTFALAASRPARSDRQARRFWPTLARRRDASPSADSAPTSVQNAIRSRRLRIDANNEVQVYILMCAVTDETVARS